MAQVEIGHQGDSLETGPPQRASRPGVAPGGTQRRHGSVVCTVDDQGSANALCSGRHGGSGDGI
jgi:hypothetical protein